MPDVRTTLARVRPAWPLLLATVLAVLVLAPTLAPGHVLTYDMVWVPHLDLGVTTLGLGTSLPRAVPSDGVVAVLDQVVPAQLLQKLVLVGALVGGAPALARLCGGPVVARAVAVTLWVWNPFVVERLVLGAWPLLVGYAVLPWLLLHATRRRADGVGQRPLAWLLVLVPLGSLSASAGLVSVVALAASRFLGPGRGTGEPAVRGRTLVAIAAVGQAPWVVTGLLHAGDAVPGVPGFEVFAPSAEGFGSPLVAALSWGGAWNTEVTPLSRLDGRGWGYLVVLLLLAALGAVALRRRARSGRPTGTTTPWRALLVCWVVGYALVAVTSLFATRLEVVAAVVPGLALLRDGSRLLGLCVPLLAVLAGHGAGVVVERVTRLRDDSSEGPVAVATALVLVLAPVALLPDAAGGAGGRLAAVDYPASYADLADRVAGARQDQRTEGAVLVLPLSTYRAPAWNAGRPVLDPVPRLVPGDVVAGGGLLVSGRLLPGEDPRELAAARALAVPGDAGARRRALADLGVGTVVVDTTAPGGAEALARLGVPVTAGPPDVPGPVVVGLPAPSVRTVPVGWAVAAALGWTGYGTTLLCGLVLLLRGAVTRSSWRRRRAAAVTDGARVC